MFKDIHVAALLRSSTCRQEAVLDKHPDSGASRQSENGYFPYKLTNQFKLRGCH